MPVGAIVGTAVIGAGASLASSSSNSKAINKATDAQTQAASQNTALQREIYGQNKNVLMPYVNTGYQANSAINALLGLSGTGPTVGAPATSQQPQAQQNALYSQLPAGMPAYKQQQIAGTNGYEPTYQGAAPTMAQNQGQVTTAATPANALAPYQQAFQNYQNSTGYQFRVGQGSNALNASFAARGLGNSGASAKAAQTFGQNIASDEFGNYMGYLSGQQNVGLGAGSALAGVGQNFVNGVSANNNNAASAIANGAYNKAANTSSMWANIAGIGANALGGLSSYNRPSSPYGIY